MKLSAGGDQTIQINKLQQTLANNQHGVFIHPPMGVDQLRGHSENTKFNYKVTYIIKTLLMGSEVMKFGFFFSTVFNLVTQ